jgi:hypothetical protein
VDGEHTYLTMYQLEDENVLQTDAYLQHRHDPSPWTVRMMTHHPFIRSIYRQLLVADAGGPQAMKVRCTPLVSRSVRRCCT